MRSPAFNSQIATLSPSCVNRQGPLQPLPPTSMHQRNADHAVPHSSIHGESICDEARCPIGRQHAAASNFKDHSMKRNIWKTAISCGLAFCLGSDLQGAQTISGADGTDELLAQAGHGGQKGGGGHQGGVRPGGSNPGRGNPGGGGHVSPPHMPSAATRRLLILTMEPS